MSEGLTIFLIFGAIFCGILLFVCMILQCMGFPSEKKTLERELKRVLVAPVSEQGRGGGEGVERVGMWVACLFHQILRRDLVVGGVMVDAR